MGRKQILIVEDDPIWRNILRKSLEGSPEEFVICTAATYDEALEQLKQRQFALVTMDIKLVGSELAKAGLDLVDYIANFCESTKIIVVSGLDMSVKEMRNLFKEYEIFDFFKKTGFNRKEFIEGVKEAIKNSADGPEDERAALQRELAQCKGNLYKLRKAAVCAAGETPMHLINQIEAEEKEIRRIEVALENLGG